jgi:hypothetical protein
MNVVPQYQISKKLRTWYILYATAFKLLKFKYGNVKIKFEEYEAGLH